MQDTAPIEMLIGVGSSRSLAIVVHGGDESRHEIIKGQVKRNLVNHPITGRSLTQEEIERFSAESRFVDCIIDAVTAAVRDAYAAPEPW